MPELNAREAAFFALTSHSFIEDSLREWQQSNPSQKDFNLAFEIAYGTCRQKRALDYLAEKSLNLKFLPKKKKELALLELTLYQIFFLERIPQFAIVSESVNIAKKHISLPFSKFINATFRHLKKESLVLPDDLGLKTSYPEEFVQQLIKERTYPKAKEILEVQNKVFPSHARIRNPSFECDYKILIEEPFKVVEIPNGEELKKMASNPDIYIQNGTFIQLLTELSSHLKEPPKAILDLTAAPGGKLITLHDLYQQSALYANDLKTEMLKANLEKYQIEATVTEGPAEKYESEQKFDLIICDLPCSNSGVLHKRPEARWRLTPAHMQELEKRQMSILEHAKTLLKPDGQIWYMTCSILKDENEYLTDKSGLKKVFEITHLPNFMGFDGGYGCILTQST